MSVLTSSNVGSDNKMVLGTMPIKLPSNKKLPPQNIEKLNIEQLRDETTEWLYRKRLKQKFKSRQPR